MKTINLQPSPTSYAKMLVMLLKDGTKHEDRQWAADELVRFVSGLEEALEVADARLEEANKLGLYWQAEAEQLAEQQGEDSHV